MLGYAFGMSGMLLASIALLSPVSSHAPVASDEEVCLCKMSVSTATDTTPSADGGIFITGCGLCIGVFTELVDIKKGVCTGQACRVKGECKGTLRVQISSVNLTCCQAATAGGFQPSWGSGWLPIGSTATKIFDAVSVKCGGTPAEEKFSLKWRNSALQESAEQKIKSVISCGDCDGGRVPADSVQGGG